MDEIDEIRKVSIQLTTTFERCARNELYETRNALMKKLFRLGRLRYVWTEKDERGVEFHLYRSGSFFVHSKVYFGFQRKIISEKSVNHLGRFHFTYRIADKYSPLAM